MANAAVILIIKAPNQQIKDQVVKCDLGWTIGRLKEYLSEVYPSKPVSRVKASRFRPVKAARVSLCALLFFLSPHLSPLPSLLPRFVLRHFRKITVFK